MPSTNQSGRKTSNRDFDSDAKKMLATKNDLTIAALIRGIRDPDRVDEYVRAEVELADEEGRDPRKDIIGALNRKKTALTPDEDGEDTVEPAPEPDDTDGTDDDRGDDVDDADPDDAGSDDTTDDSYPDVPRFESEDALREAIDDHDHKDTFTVAKPAGKLAGCFECESHIGLVPRDGAAE